MSKRDPAKAPRFRQWLAAPRGDGRVGGFDTIARARVVEAVAACGRLDLAARIAGVAAGTVSKWRKLGLAQIRDLERHEDRQDRLCRADPSRQREPYPGRLDAAEFLLDVERAAAWWQAQHLDRLQAVAEDTTDPRHLSVTMYLVNRNDRLDGKLKGDVHEHHHHEAPSAAAKLSDIVKRRAALRGGEPEP